MKKIITLAILVAVSTSVQMITYLPWWSFLFAMFFLGVILPIKRWKIPSFLWGLISGMLVWVISTLYFESIYEGEILSKVSKVMDISNCLLYVIIGLIGGLLNGLSFYSGFLLRKRKEDLHL
ncbi:MAG: hypothetical protein V4677_00605 [Bacteroidota bacterium]